MSKELEALEKLKQNHKDNSHLFDYVYLEVIEIAIKVLEIIKPYCLIADYKTDDPDTSYELAFCKKVCITKEEYDLLKEVLDND